MKDDKNPFVAISAVISSITMIMLLFVLLFAQEQASALVTPIVGSMAVLGIALGYFAFKAQVSKSSRKSRR